jgi:peptidoglycan/LPS O-acetylase OafA/YrhL
MPQESPTTKTKGSFAAWLRQKLVFPSSGQHWDCLDGLRGMAILMVVCAHAFFYTSPNIRYAGWPRLLHAFVGSGHLGVQVFFVLSGFLISQPFFAARLANPRFWYPYGYSTRRFLKIIPPCYLTIAAFSAYFFWVGNDPVQLKYGAFWLAGIPDFVNLPTAFDFNPVFWSLWVEVGFYVLLPILFFLFRGFGNRATGTAVFLLLLVVPFLTRQLLPAGPSGTLFYAARFPNGLTNFSWGVLFACLYSAKAGQDGGMRKFASMGYLGIFLLAVTMFLDAKYFLLKSVISFEVPLNLVGPAVFLALFFVFDPTVFGARFFSIPAVRYLGLVSYEWFLLHFQALEKFRAWMGGIPYSTKNLWHYLFTALIPMVLSLLAAMAVYHYFSLPLIRWGRGRLKAGQKVTAKSGISQKPLVTPAGAKE